MSRTVSETLLTLKGLSILRQTPLPASELNSAVGQTVGRVVHKAMAKQPWHRFASVREFGESLNKALRNEPIEFFDAAKLRPPFGTRHACARGGRSSIRRRASSGFGGGKCYWNPAASASPIDVTSSHPSQANGADLGLRGVLRRGGGLPSKFPLRKAV
jgi:hypothetical protein